MSNECLFAFILVNSAIYFKKVDSTFYFEIEGSHLLEGIW